MGNDPGGEKASSERQATPLRCCYKCTLTHPSPSDSGPQLVAAATNNFCIRASAGLLLSGSRPRESLRGHRSPLKMKGDWPSCSTSTHPPPRSPPGLSPPALPRLRAASRSGDPGGRHPPALCLPRLAGAGWGQGPRAASRCSFPRRLCGRQIGAGELSGRRGGRPQPSRRRGPGEGAVCAARIARRGPSRRSPLTSANFWGPLGGSERTRARAPGSPRPGWASRRLVGAPGHSPPPRGAARARWPGRFTAPLHSAPS